jgi:hypothetical protein
MFTGPPLPLSLDITIRHLLELTHGLPSAGAWVREAPRELRMRLSDPGRRSRILISRDLGLLLRRCRKIVLRSGSDAVVLEASVLIQWRALQVVTGTPCLPAPERLKEIFPEAHLDASSFEVPIQSRLPEEVLTDCLLHGIPVAESRVVYVAPAQPSASPLR